MELKLDGAAIKELFEQYATPALKSKVRETVKEGLENIVKEEVEKKVNAFLTEQRIEKIFRDVLKKDIFKNLWAHEKNKSLEFMDKIILEEFKAKAENVNFEKIEDLVTEECREMINGKMKRYTNIVKLIDDNT